VACSEHDTGPSGSTGGWEFYQLSDCLLFEERFVTLVARGSSVNEWALVDYEAYRVITFLKSYMYICTYVRTYVCTYVWARARVCMYSTYTYGAFKYVTLTPFDIVLCNVA
jgi:hypothetical protein